jgi:hypothetical protein
MKNYAYESMEKFVCDFLMRLDFCKYEARCESDSRINPDSEAYRDLVNTPRSTKSLFIDAEKLSVKVKIENVKTSIRTYLEANSKLHCYFFHRL